ncbi:MAG: metallophosphoesterase [Hyalangium sp.]|uniref:metallophosphoesterase n=1 Tax=Hyalangium sp. TaxID=2028555 RepID=UPI00389A854A
MMWRPSGALSDPKEDYRSPKVISEIVREARQGVAVVGVSRLGKTSLLYRLKEQPELPGCVLVDVHEEPKATLDQMNGEAQCFLFDEAQYFVGWKNAELVELRRRIGGRRFVMAGWPTLLKDERPPELERLLNNAVIRMLAPFTLQETERMVRRELSDQPLECEAKIVHAIHEATGGFPNLIARFCRYLSDNERRPLRAPTKKDSQDFLHALREAMDPLQLIYGSLPPRMQEVLDEHRAGREARLEALSETGLIRSDGRQTRFSGTLFKLAWGPESEWRPASPPEVSRGPVTSGDTGVHRPVFTWLHVSDLHFGGGAASHRHNREEVLKAMLEDVRSHKPWIPDRIFVTGDIAWKADPQEYREARSWLNQLAAVAGVDASALRLVPGNHDVDRGLTKGLSVRRHHGALRDEKASQAVEREKRPVALLDESLKDSAIRSELRKKLEAYVSFVKEIAARHPDNGAGEPLDWAEAVEPAAGRPGRLWLVGLCSVWVSDDGDGERKLFLGEEQLRALKDVGPQDVLLVLTHHPPGWLHGDCETLLLRRMAERAHHLHLCGHVHSAEALALRGFGRTRESFRFVAGAGHGDAEGEHAYAWGALRWNEAKRHWELGWAPRVFVPGEGWKRERNRYDVGDDGFAWQPLPLLKWEPPGSG